MARVLFLSNPGTISHLNPLIRPARQLQQRGNTVAFVATTQSRVDELAPYDLEVFRTQHEQPRWEPATGATFAEWYPHDELLREALRQTMFRAVDVLVEDMRAIVRDFKPDVMAIDGVTYAGMIAAALEGVPCIGVDMALKMLAPSDLEFRFARIVRSVAAERAQLFAKYGLAPEFRLMECLSPYDNAVFATEAFVGASNVRLVGPSLPDGKRGDAPRSFPWERLDASRPLVYAALGNLAWRLRPDVFQTIANGCRDLGVQLVMAVGDTQIDADPRDVIAVPYAPQLELLERASVFITHGGGSSVMESLAYGVPMVVLPVMIDTPVQAHFVAASGAGLALLPSAITEHAVRAAVQALAAPEGAYRAHAKRIEQSYRAHDGGSGLADALLALVGAGRDVSIWRR